MGRTEPGGEPGLCLAVCHHLLKGTVADIPDSGARPALKSHFPSDSLGELGNLRSSFEPQFLHWPLLWWHQALSCFKPLYFGPRGCSCLECSSPRILGYGIFITDQILAYIGHPFPQSLTYPITLLITLIAFIKSETVVFIYLFTQLSFSFPTRISFMQAARLFKNLFTAVSWGPRSVLSRRKSLNQ